MANCTKHRTEKTLSGQFRTKRKVYQFKACAKCYEDAPAVVKVLSSLVYEVGLRKR